MHPMFVKLFLENEPTTCWPRRRTGAGPRTGPGGSGRARPPGSSLVAGIAGPSGEVPQAGPDGLGE